MGLNRQCLELTCVDSQGHSELHGSGKRSSPLHLISFELAICFHTLKSLLGQARMYALMLPLSTIMAFANIKP